MSKPGRIVNRILGGRTVPRIGFDFSHSLSNQNSTLSALSPPTSTHVRARAPNRDTMPGIIDPIQIPYGTLTPEEAQDIRHCRCRVDAALRKPIFWTSNTVRIARRTPITPPTPPQPPTRHCRSHHALHGGGGWGAPPGQRRTFLQ